MTWDLALGDIEQRTSLQQRHGGSLARGISAPSPQERGVDIMLWWRPEHGELYGYSDGWANDGAFYFSGTGQIGDQRFESPNAENGRVRDHVKNGDRLRLMRYVAKNPTQYIGELRLDPDDPWHWRDAPDARGHMRRLIEFRLLPVGEILRNAGEIQRDDPREIEPEPPPQLPSPGSPTAIEALRSKAFERAVRAQAQVVRRQELVLVHSFAEWLEDRHSLTSSGLRIPFSPERRSLRADLFITGPHVLVEAKVSAAREHVRMALGQLLDYRRYIEPMPRVCILTPARPTDDMLALLDEFSVGIAWRNDDGFMVEPLALLSVDVSQTRSLG